MVNALRDPITVLILSWNRPIFLWVCLDSLYRFTRCPARFILVDNGSDDPNVRNVVEGFQRRGMFFEVSWERENAGDRVETMVAKYRELFGEYFAYVESDISVFDTDPCWLSRMTRLMDDDPTLGMLGSYIDGRDFVDPSLAGRLAPNMNPLRRDDLIKARSRERELPLTPPEKPIIDPFNPPGRLLLMRTELLDSVRFTSDYLVDLQAKAAGYRTGIATEVRHRHLSLLSFFDYPVHNPWSSVNREP